MNKYFTPGEFCEDCGWQDCKHLNPEGLPTAPPPASLGGWADGDPPCERCGDMFYHPKTVIECEKQRAAEWEEIAIRERTSQASLSEALKRGEEEMEKLWAALKTIAWIASCPLPSTDWKASMKLAQKVAGEALGDGEGKDG